MVGIVGTNLSKMRTHSNKLYGSNIEYTNRNKNIKRYVSLTYREIREKLLRYNNVISHFGFVTIIFRLVVIKREGNVA